MLKSLFLDVVKIKVNIWLLFVEWIELLEDNEKSSILVQECLISSH